MNKCYCGREPLYIGRYYGKETGNLYTEADRPDGRWFYCEHDKDSVVSFYKNSHAWNLIIVPIKKTDIKIETMEL